MFEDLTRLIDQQIYLATQANLQRLQGLQNNGNEPNYARLESVAATAAAAATGARRKGRSRTRSSTSRFSSSPVTSMEAATPAQSRQEEETLYHDAEEELLPYPSAMRKIDARAMPVTFSSSPPDSSMRSGGRRLEGLALAFERWRLAAAYARSQANGTTSGNPPEEKEDSVGGGAMPGRRMEREARNDTIQALFSSPRSSLRSVENRGGLARAFEELRLGGFNTNTQGNGTRRTTSEEEQPSTDGARVVQSMESKVTSNTATRPWPSFPRGLPPDTPTKYPRMDTPPRQSGMDAFATLKALPQPILRATGATTTTGTELQAHGSPVSSPRRVVRISRSSPQRVAGASPLKHGLMGGTPVRRIAVHDDGRVSNKIDNSISDASNSSNRINNLQSLPETLRSSVPSATHTVPRVVHEQFTQPAAKESQGQGQYQHRHHQQQREDEEGRPPNEEEDEGEEDLDSSPLSKISTITLLVGDIPQLKTFYEQVFQISPTYEDDVSAIFPFNGGRLGVTLVDSREAEVQSTAALQFAGGPEEDASSADSDYFDADDGNNGWERALLQSHWQQQQSHVLQLARYRDVAMSVRVDDLEFVWERLNILREGKGKGREVDGNTTSDGLDFTGLSAELEGGSGDSTGPRRKRIKRIKFCDPAGYCWEITKGSSRG